jgi:hypothetical protein
MLFACDLNIWDVAEISLELILALVTDIQRGYDA